MNCRKTFASGLKLVTPWLAGLLAALMVVLSVGSAAHRDHDEHSDQADHQSCAACLIAHGGVLADGALGTTIISSCARLVLPRLGEPLSASIFDLRLAPGRAPPV